MPTGPLTKPLGHNGPYIGVRDTIDYDCSRVPNHSDLFRSLDTFDEDLKTASGRLERTSERVTVALEEKTTRPRDLLPSALAALRSGARYLRDAMLIAEILDERERRRLLAIGQGSFHDIVLRSMSSAELGDTLLKLEARSRDTRRMIATIHAERTRRHARQS